MPTTEHNLNRLLPEIMALARHAGAIIMDYYQNGAAIEIKNDGSPVTAADRASHDYITGALKSLNTGFEIISEENETQPDVSDGRPFWTVDPLDGTKGFINRTGQFYVKIALVENFRPVMGVIYEPVSDTIYFSIRGGKSYRQQGHKQAEEIATRPAPQKGALTTIFNRLHSSADAYEIARRQLAQRNLEVPPREAAIGSCRTAFFMAVASGMADAYLDCGNNASLREGNGFSWDYAPDSLILKNAGGMVIEIVSGQERIFDKPAERMNACIGLGDRDLGKRVFPEFKNDCV